MASNSKNIAELLNTDTNVTVADFPATMDLSSNTVTLGTVYGNPVGNTYSNATTTGSTTLDFSTYTNFILTLTGNVTLANPTTEAAGQSGFIVFIQDATGSRTVALGTDYETAGAAGITLSTAASSTDIVPYVVHSSGRILLGTPQLAFS